MDGELDLLLSVAGGLGKWRYVDDLKRVYIKDDDCLGEVIRFNTLKRFSRKQARVREAPELHRDSPIQQYSKAAH